MDHGLGQGRVCAEMKAKQRSHPSSRQAAVCVGSDTESLVQERASQQELRRQTGCHTQNKYTLPEKEESESLPGGEEDEDDAAGLPLSDSLEVTSKRRSTRSPTLQNTECLDPPKDVREGRRLLPDDSYSDLRYDPNWKTNLRAASLNSPQSSVEACCRSYDARQGPELKGGYRYVADTAPPVTPAVGVSDRPFHLHLEDGPTMREPQRSQASTEKDDVSSEDCDSEDVLHTELKNSCQQRRNARSNSQQRSQVEDFVELNKITLGCIRPKAGSYGRVHACKQAPSVSEVHEMPEKPGSVTQQQDRAGPEQRWLQRTQQLRGLRNGNGKKAQRRDQKPPAAGVKPGPGPCAQPESKKSSSQPLPSSIQLKISFSTSAELLSFLQQRTGPDALIDLASLQGRPHWSLRSLRQPVLTTGSQQKAKPSKMSSLPREALNAQLCNGSLESSSEQRASPVPVPLSCEQEEQSWNLPRSPTPSWSQGPAPYAVLPAIGKWQCGDAALPTQHSSSDSYLGQMERKQLKARLDFEKMIRQKLYSETIREQNKKTSRIPILPPKDQEGSKNKVPRIKALEYAKTIAKPPVKAQPKQRQASQDDESQHRASDECLLTRLGLLRKRHEEEKQVVARFRKPHAV